jgi:hypothetical protein
MTENPACYTTAYEIRIVKTLYALITANGIILLSFTLNRLPAAGMGVIHGYILGMILSYLLFGIARKKRNRRIIAALGCGMLGILAVLDWRLETNLSCSAPCLPWRLSSFASTGTMARLTGTMRLLRMMILTGPGLILSLKVLANIPSCFPRT